MKKLDLDGHPLKSVIDLAYCLNGVATRCIKSCFEGFGIQQENMAEACGGCDRGKGEILLHFAKFQEPRYASQNARIPINLARRDKGLLTVHALNDVYLEVFPADASDPVKIFPEEGYVIANFGKAMKRISGITAPLYRAVHEQVPSNYAIAVSIAPQTKLNSVFSGMKPVG